MKQTLRHGLPALLAIFAFSACGRKQAAPPPQPPRLVTAAQAVTGDVPLYLDEIGNCAAVESVAVQPQVSGQITQIHFTDGAEVKKGDPLFTIDPRPYEAALERAKATLAQDTAKAQNDAIQFTRTQELRKTKVVAPQEFDIAQANFNASQAQVQADKAAVATAQINLDYCFIKAPIEGRTGKRLVDVGNVVAPGAGTTLVSIERQNPIYVEFTTAERNLDTVREHQARAPLKVEARFSTNSNKRREGTLDFIDNTVQAAAGTVRLRATMPNDDRMFWPGQFVSVRLVLDVLENAVLVPNAAVQVGQNGPFVFIVKADSTVELRPVTPGQRQEQNVVIRDGIKAGETVVLTGQLMLAPGSKVAIAPPQQAAPQSATAQAK